MAIWTPRAVGLESGRSAHYEGLMPGAAAIVLAGRAVRLWLYARGGRKTWNVTVPAHRRFVRKPPGPRATAV